MFLKMINCCLDMGKIEKINKTNLVTVPLPYQLTHHAVQDGDLNCLCPL